MVLLSCGENKAQKEAATKDIPEKEAVLKHVEVDIDGMTCEIGCARLIQSKLSKVDGVTYTKVSFKDGKGQFTYDSNKLSVQEIIDNIEKIAGGDLYTVSDSRDISEITMTPDTSSINKQ